MKTIGQDPALCINMRIDTDRLVTGDFTRVGTPEAYKVLRPVLFIQDNTYCCVWGPDTLYGIFGCGATPDEAILEWEIELKARIRSADDDDELAATIINALGQYSIRQRRG